MESHKRGRRRKGWRHRIIQCFSPSWFSVTMGTGVNCSLLLALPWDTWQPIVRPIALMFLILDIFLFIAFLVMITIRYTKDPESLSLTLNRSQHWPSIFLACIPMELAIILSGISVIAQQSYGLGVDWTLAVSFVWWIDAVASCLVALLVPYVLFMNHRHVAENYTAVLLLPVAPTVTAAASGGRMALLLLPTYPVYARTICLASYSILGIGLFLAMMIFGSYLRRFDDPFSIGVIVRVFLPLGPCGQGGYALILLGKAILELSLTPFFPFYLTLVIVMFSLLCGMVLFVLGMWWWLYTVDAFISSIQGNLAQKPGFDMGWWDFTFPLASLTLCTLSLPTELYPTALKLIRPVMVFVAFMLWFYVAIRSTTGVFREPIFHVPFVLNRQKDQHSLTGNKNGLSEAEKRKSEDLRWLYLKTRV